MTGTQLQHPEAVQYLYGTLDSILEAIAQLEGVDMPTAFKNWASNHQQLQGVIGDMRTGGGGR